MRQMEEACNMNIAEEVNPSWINVLDEMYDGVVQQVCTTIYVRWA